MKGFIIKLVVAAIVIVTLLCVFNYYFPYSKGFRAGELVKFSNKGVIFKTWEGEMSQGVSESTRFFFSVKKNNKTIIDQLSNFQGKKVKLTYSERYFTFPWVSETNYFIEKVEDEKLLESNVQ